MAAFQSLFESRGGILSEYKRPPPASDHTVSGAAKAATRKRIEIVQERAAGSEAESEAISDATSGDEGLNLSRKQKKLKKRRKVVDVVDASGPDAADSKGVALQDKRVLRKFLRVQAHNAKLPHLERPDLELRLRTLSTNAILKLFNAVANTQREAKKAASETASVVSGRSSVAGSVMAASSAAAGSAVSTASTRNEFIQLLRKASEQRRAADAKSKASRPSSASATYVDPSYAAAAASRAGDDDDSSVDFSSDSDDDQGSKTSKTSASSGGEEKEAE